MMRINTVAMCFIMSICANDGIYRHQYVIAEGAQIGYLIKVVAEGEAVAQFVGLPSARHDWTIQVEDGKMKIWCRGASTDERKYLSFRIQKQKFDDAAKKELDTKLVLLTTKLTESCIWDVEIETVNGNEMSFYLKASMGDYKGWYLCPGDAVDNLRTSNNPKVGFKARSVTMSPEKKLSYRLGNGMEGK